MVYLRSILAINAINRKRDSTLYLGFSPKISTANILAMVLLCFEYDSISAVKFSLSKLISGKHSICFDTAIIVRNVGRGTRYLSPPMCISTGSLLIASAANFPIIIKMPSFRLPQVFPCRQT